MADGGIITKAIYDSWVLGDYLIFESHVQAEVRCAGEHVFLHNFSSCLSFYSLLASDFLTCRAVRDRLVQEHWAARRCVPHDEPHQRGTGGVRSHHHPVQDHVLLASIRPRHQLGRLSASWSCMSLICMLCSHFIFETCDVCVEGRWEKEDEDEDEGRGDCGMTGRFSFYTLRTFLQSCPVYLTHFLSSPESFKFIPLLSKSHSISSVSCEYKTKNTFHASPPEPSHTSPFLANT
jgi:hypothetical protein